MTSGAEKCCVPFGIHPPPQSVANPKCQRVFFLILQLLLFCCVLGFLCGENKGREGDKAPSLAEGKNDQATQHTKWAKDVADFYNMLPRHEGPATKSFPPIWKVLQTQTPTWKSCIHAGKPQIHTQRETCSGRYSYEKECIIQIEPKKQHKS